MAVPALRRGLGDSNPDTAGNCVRALMVIGPPAKEAAPELLRMNECAFDRRSQFNYYCLKKLGADAVPAIVEAMADPAEEGVRWAGPPRVRHAKLLAEIAEEIGPAARAALPACQKALTDKNIRVRTHVATTLRFIGKDAEPAIPALVLALRRDKELEKEPDLFLWGYYREVAEALAKIGPDSSVATNALREAANDQRHPGRTFIGNALHRVEEGGKVKK